MAEHQHIELFNKLKVLMLEYNIQKYCMDGEVPEDLIIIGSELVEEIDSYDLYQEFVDFLTFNELDKFSVFVDDFFNFYDKGGYDDGGGRGGTVNTGSTDFSDDFRPANPDLGLDSGSLERHNEQRSENVIYANTSSAPFNLDTPAVNMENNAAVLNSNSVRLEQQNLLQATSNELSESQKRVIHLMNIVNRRNQVAETSQNNTSRPLPRPLPPNRTPRLGTADIQRRPRTTGRLIIPPPQVIIIPKRKEEFNIMEIEYKEIIFDVDVFYDNHESFVSFNNTEYLEILSRRNKVNIQESSDLQQRLSLPSLYHRYNSNLESSQHISPSITDHLQNININDDDDNYRIDYVDELIAIENILDNVTENVTLQQEGSNKTTPKTISTTTFYGNKLSSILETCERTESNSRIHNSSSVQNLPLHLPFDSLCANYNPQLPSTSEAPENNLNNDNFEDVNIENINENIISNNSGENRYLEILRQRNPNINYGIMGGGAPVTRKRKREREENVNNVNNPQNMNNTCPVINPENVINTENINADATRKKNIQDFKKLQEQFVTNNGQNYQNVMKFDFDCYTTSYDPDEFTSFLNIFRLLIESRGNPVDRNFLLPEQISDKETTFRSKAIKTLTDIEIAEILNNDDDNDNDEASNEIQFSAIQLKKNPKFNSI